MYYHRYSPPIDFFLVAQLTCGGTKTAVKHWSGEIGSRQQSTQYPIPGVLRVV